VRPVLTTTCGSVVDLPIGYVPPIRAGHVIGYKFIGKVADIGAGVGSHRIPNQVVVLSFIAATSASTPEGNRLVVNSELAHRVGGHPWVGDHPEHRGHEISTP
jgi:hypothetical protein